MSHSDDTTRLNIFLDDELHRDLKILSAMESVSMQDLVTRFLDQSLDRDSKLVRSLIEHRRRFSGKP